jgi:protein-S-isoprenylcysteine O-methyltransferase Ste14
MTHVFLGWLPPVVAVSVYLARIIEVRTNRHGNAQASRKNVTLRLFVLLGTVMLAGSLAEYFFLRKTILWPVFGLGVVVALFSFFLRRRAIAALGRYWSFQVEIRETHELVREGPFRWIRHPAYASMILELLSLALLLGSWWTALVVYSAFLPTLVARIRTEENALIEKFGQNYIDFKRTTPALVPRLLRHS